MNRKDLFDAVEKVFQAEVPDVAMDDPSMCYIGGITDRGGRAIVFCNNEFGGEVLRHHLEKVGRELQEMQRKDPIEKIDELLDKVMAAAKKDKQQDDDPLATMVEAIVEVIDELVDKVEKKLKEKADKSKA